MNFFAPFIWYFNAICFLLLIIFVPLIYFFIIVCYLRVIQLIISSLASDDNRYGKSFTLTLGIIALSLIFVLTDLVLDIPLPDFGDNPVCYIEDLKNSFDLTTLPIGLALKISVGLIALLLSYTFGPVFIASTRNALEAIPLPRYPEPRIPIPRFPLPPHP